MSIVNVDWSTRLPLEEPHAGQSRPTSPRSVAADLRRFGRCECTMKDERRSRPHRSRSRCRTPRSGRAARRRSPPSAGPTTPARVPHDLVQRRRPAPAARRRTRFGVIACAGRHRERHERRRSARPRRRGARAAGRRARAPTSRRADAHIRPSCAPSRMQAPVVAVDQRAEPKATRAPSARAAPGRSRRRPPTSWSDRVRPARTARRP